MVWERGSREERLRERVRGTERKRVDSEGDSVREAKEVKSVGGKA